MTAERFLIIFSEVTLGGVGNSGRSEFTDRDAVDLSRRIEAMPHASGGKYPSADGRLDELVVEPERLMR